MQGQFEFLSRKPGSRNSDPESSHLAEHRFKQSGAQLSHADACLALVRKYPGLTAAEYALKAETDPCCAGLKLDHVAIARRLPDLREVNLVFNPEDGNGKRLLKHCSVKQCRCIYWMPADVRRAAAA